MLIQQNNRTTEQKEQRNNDKTKDFIPGKWHMSQVVFLSLPKVSTVQESESGRESDTWTWVNQAGPGSFKLVRRAWIKRRAWSGLNQGLI